MHRRVADSYVEALCTKAASLKVGNPAQAGISIGPLINRKQRDRVPQHRHPINLTGRYALPGGTFRQLFYQPTVLANVLPEMAAFQDEIFGPVAPVIVAEDDDHAVELANLTEYGLAAAVQTGSLDRGLRLARRLRAGMVHVNDQTVNDATQCPMGGFGQSGNGSRFGSLTNRDQFTEWQWLTASGTARQYGF